MRWTLFIVLLLVWLVCLIAFKTISLFVHLILLLAAALLLWRLLAGKK